MEKVIVSLSAEQTAAWLRGEETWLSGLTDEDVKSNIIEQQRLLKEAMVEAAQVFAKALDEHSKQSSLVVLDYAQRAKEGDEHAARQLWNFMTELLNVAHTRIS